MLYIYIYPVSSPPLHRREPMAPKSENQAWLSALRHTTLASIPMAIEAAMELNVFEILSTSKNGEPLSAQEIISSFETPAKNPNAHLLLDRLLHLLTLPALSSAQPLLKAHGLSPLDQQLHKYSLLPPAQFFIKDAHGLSLGSSMLDRIKKNVDAYSHLPSVIVEGGEDGFQRAFAQKISHSVAHDSSSNHHIALMSYLNQIFMEQFLEVYDGFNNISTLVDVGGNTGSTLAHIVDKYTHLKGINFDQPHVVSSAPNHPRIEHVGGNMLESIPSADAALLKLIIHDWEDDECIKILSNCKKTINPKHGKVIIVETNVQNTALDPILANQLGILSMSSHGSKCRTIEDYKRLGDDAGFSHVKVACFVNEFIVLELIP